MNGFIGMTDHTYLHMHLHLQEDGDVRMRCQTDPNITQVVLLLDDLTFYMNFPLLGMVGLLREEEGGGVHLLGNALLFRDNMVVTRGVEIFNHRIVYREQDAVSDSTIIVNVTPMWILNLPVLQTGSSAF